MLQVLRKRRKRRNHTPTNIKKRKKHAETEKSACHSIRNVGPIGLETYFCMSRHFRRLIFYGYKDRQTSFCFCCCRSHSIGFSDYRVSDSLSTRLQLQGLLQTGTLQIPCSSIWREEKRIQKRVSHTKWKEDVLQDILPPRQ